MYVFRGQVLILLSGSQCVCVFRGQVLYTTHWKSVCEFIEDRYFILLTGRQCESIDRYLYDCVSLDDRYFIRFNENQCV